jgi:hypothetical protein
MKKAIFLTHRGKDYTVDNYLRSWGGALEAKISVRHYFGLGTSGQNLWKRFDEWRQFLRTGTLRRELTGGPAKVYIFADIERLTDREKEKASALRQRLATSDGSPRILNDPSRVLNRFELLRKLYEEGINSFNAYMAEERIEPERWPVFIRHHRRHGEVLTRLLRNSEELKKEIDRLLESGRSPHELLIVEFCDTSDASGITRKYGAFRVGDRILGRHIHFGRNWFLRSPEIKTEESTREELAYVTSNDHHELLERVFALSCVDYGRLDYTEKDGDLYVWEINTNPMILVGVDREDPLRFEAHRHFTNQFHAALEHL